MRKTRIGRITKLALAAALSAGALALSLASGGSGAVAEAGAGPRQPPGNAESLCPGNCSEAMIKGCYAIELTGWVGSGPGRLPYASVGFFYADGKGTLSGTDTMVIDGGPPVQRAVTATYTVDPNTCTGTAVSDVGTFNFVITDSGKEIRNISTTPGTTITGTSRRQFGS